MKIFSLHPIIVTQNIEKVSDIEFIVLHRKQRGWGVGVIHIPPTSDNILWYCIQQAHRHLIRIMSLMGLDCTSWVERVK